MRCRMRMTWRCSRGSQLHRSDAAGAAPIGIGLGDVAGDVLSPRRSNVRVQIEVERSVDDLPDARVAVELLSERRAVRAEAPIGRQIFVGIRLEGIEVRLAG